MYVGYRDCRYKDLKRRCFPGSGRKARVADAQKLKVQVAEKTRRVNHCVMTLIFSLKTME